MFRVHVSFGRSKMVNWQYSRGRATHTREKEWGRHTPNLGSWLMWFVPKFTFRYQRTDYSKRLGNLRYHQTHANEAAMPLRMNISNATHPGEPHHSRVDRNLWETPHILAFMAKCITCLSTHDNVNPPSQGWAFKRQLWAHIVTKQLMPTVFVGDQTFAFNLFSRGNSFMNLSITQSSSPPRFSQLTNLYF